MLSLCEFRTLIGEESTRRAEKLAVVENELEEKSVMRDVVLSVRMSVDSEERREVGSNMAMLSLVSDYFHALFQGDSSLRRGETIELSAKLTLEGMSAINALAFGVLSKVQVSRDNLAHLMAAAEYCDVPALSQLCDEFAYRCTVSGDSSTLTKLIVDLDELGYAHKADEYLTGIPRSDLKNIFLDENALGMSLDLFCSILKSDDLMLSEDKIWHKCVKWSENQASINSESELLTHLTKLKPYIRFPLMSENFLMTEVDKTKLLSPEEFYRVFSVRNGRLRNSPLFCSASERKKGLVWDRQGTVAECHRIDECGSLLTHVGKSEWSNAFVSGEIPCDGATEIEFENVTSKGHTMFGVLQASEKPTAGQNFASSLKGVGYYPSDGHLYQPEHYPLKVGESLSKGDRLKLTVAFSDPFHATLDFYQNGKHICSSVNLDGILDLSQGLRFSVQTYKEGTKVRICET